VFVVRCHVLNKLVVIVMLLMSIMKVNVIVT